MIVSKRAVLQLSFFRAFYPIFWSSIFSHSFSIHSDFVPLCHFSQKQRQQKTDFFLHFSSVGKSAIESLIWWCLQFTYVAFSWETFWTKVSTENGIWDFAASLLLMLLLKIMRKTPFSVFCLFSKKTRWSLVAISTIQLFRLSFNARSLCVCVRLFVSCITFFTLSHAKSNYNWIIIFLYWISITCHQCDFVRSIACKRLWIAFLYWETAILMA